jgi:anti-sigma regulatory factor (Ser/Thr protein kinase)
MSGRRPAGQQSDTAASAALWSEGSAVGSDCSVLGMNEGSDCVGEGFAVGEPFDVDSLHDLRTRVQTLTSRLGMSVPASAAVVLVVSELATNAVVHGGGHGWASLWFEDGIIWCRVRDDGPGIADPDVGKALPPPEQPTGRGLWIVRRLASRLVIGAGASGRGAVITAAL